MNDTAAAPGKLYRVRTPKPGFDLISGRELAELLVTLEPCARPPEPCFPVEQWYCESPECEVRTVKIARKYLDGRPPRERPRTSCPACGQPLSFHHYLREVALLPEREVSAHG
jgi:hypothetical protein